MISMVGAYIHKISLEKTIHLSLIGVYMHKTYLKKENPVNSGWHLY